ncbi:MAG: SGNH hydrolase domain-containing protein, partial [Ilumatobacteraceae bacterium]
LRPGLHDAYADKPSIYGDGCILADGRVEPKSCVFGDPTGAVSVILFGDSHMAQWFDAMDSAARANGWRLKVLTKMGCPTADVPVTNPARAAQCGPWRDRVMSRIGEIHPDLVILSAYRYQGSDDASWESGLDRTLTVLRPLAARVLVMGDTPTPRLDVPSCVAGHPRNLSSCTSSRNAAMRPGRLGAEYRTAQAHAADFVTTDDWLCTAASCPVVIGDVLVYRDDSHLTTTAATLFTPYIEAMIRPLVPST